MTWYGGSAPGWWRGWTAPRPVGCAREAIVECGHRGLRAPGPPAEAAGPRVAADAGPPARAARDPKPPARLRPAEGRPGRPGRDRVDVGRVRGRSEAGQGPPGSGDRPRPQCPVWTDALQPGRAGRAARLVRPRSGPVGQAGPAGLGPARPRSRATRGRHPPRGRYPRPAAVRSGGTQTTTRLQVGLTCISATSGTSTSRP